MSILQALVLGIIQGATEFLPISSSGHLVIVPWLLGWQAVGENDLAFDALVHWGTLVAVIGYFWSDIWRIVRAVWSGIRRRDYFGSPDARVGWYIVVGSIPAALIGFLLEEWFEGAFGRPLVAALMLFVTAGLLITAERVGSQDRGIERLNWGDAVLIGLAQALAIMPGISRSGATIAAAQSRGVQRSDAARYSFLLGVPAVVGAGLWQLVKLFEAGEFSGKLGVLLAGFLSAAIVGYLAIHTLLRYLRRRSLVLFALYCVAFGALSGVVYAIRMW